MAPLRLAPRCLAPVPLGVTRAEEAKTQVVGNSCSQHLVTLASLISWRPYLWRLTSLIDELPANQKLECAYGARIGSDLPMPAR